MLTYARKFFISNTTPVTWFLVSGILIVIGLEVGGVLYLNHWRNDFYTALQKLDSSHFWQLLGIFTAVACVLTLSISYKLYLLRLLGLRWRHFVTTEVSKKWLTNPTVIVDNPDQRIAEDIREFTYMTYDLISGGLTQLCLFIAFVFVLWDLSSDVALFGLEIPGLLLWGSLAWAVLGTFFTWITGKPLVRMEVDVQRCEANYRFGLASVRNGFDDNKHETRFNEVINALKNIFWRYKLLSFVTSGYGQLAVVIPFLFLAPNYFAEIITFGFLMQAAHAFDIVNTSSSYLIDSAIKIVDWTAAKKRINGFIGGL